MLRLISLIILPVVEILFLSIRIDTKNLIGNSAWWAVPLGNSGDIATAMFVAAAVIGLVVCARPKDAAHSQYFRTALIPPKHWQIFCLVHLLSFLIFAILTTYMVEGDAAVSAHSNMWFFCWALVGLSAVLSWSASIMPLNHWLLICRQYWPVITVAAMAAASAWLSNSLPQMLWGSLGYPTFLLAGILLQASGLEVVYEAEKYLLGTKTFEVEIAAACSGYEGIALILVLLAVYFWFFRKDLRFPRAFLLIPLGTIIIWLANAVRIALLILVGTRISPEIALGGFHSRFGSLVFISVSLGLIALAHNLPFFIRSHNKEAQKNSDSTTAYLMPLLTLVGTAMITGLFISDFDWLYPVRVVTTGTVILVYWQKSFSWSRFREMWSFFAIVTGVIVFALWMAFEWKYGTGSRESAIAMGLADASPWWAATWLVFRVIGSMITVPIAEELAFRGFLLRRLIGPEFEKVSPRKFTWFSFLVSSILFGAMHGRWVAGTAAGMLYAGVMYRQGRLSHAIVAHGITNALIASYVLLTGDWTLW